jgi:ankyrin repeat protein
LGQLGTVKILLEAGADPNLIDEDSGITPLISAVRGQYLGIICLLLQAGAKTNDKDSNGKTALDVAKEIKNSEIIRLLKEAEAVED